MRYMKKYFKQKKYKFQNTWASQCFMRNLKYAKKLGERKRLPEGELNRAW
jgi:hypothetical protein